MNIEAADMELINYLYNSIRRQFASDLIARFEIMFRGNNGLISKLFLYQLINETLNAEHPTPEQIREIEKEELP